MRHFTTKLTLLMLVSAAPAWAGMIIDAEPDSIDIPIPLLSVAATNTNQYTSTNTTKKEVQQSVVTAAQPEQAAQPEAKNAPPPPKQAFGAKNVQETTKHTPERKFGVQAIPPPPPEIHVSEPELAEEAPHPNLGVTGQEPALPIANTSTNTLKEPTKSIQITPPDAVYPRDHNFSIFIAAGNADGSVQSMATGVDIYSDKKWFSDGNWLLTPYTELLLGSWKGDPGHTDTDSLVEFGASLYLRYIRQSQHPTWLRPYADLGLGLHYLTENEIEDKELGSQWLAGSNADIGIILGRTGKVDLGLRWRHLSNGGTKEPNWGINHLMGRLAIRF